MGATMIDNDLKRIREILESKAKHPIDTCLDLCDIMVDSQQPERILQVILESPYPVGNEDDENPVAVSEEEFGIFARLNFGYIIQFSRLLARKNLPLDVFYRDLYTNLFGTGNGMLPDTIESKALVLVLLANHVRCVPYYQLTDDHDISDEEFEASLDRLESELRNSRHILQRDFSTKTEEGIQLYRIMNSIDDETDRIVYLSVLLGMVRMEAQRDNGA